VENRQRCGKAVQNTFEVDVDHLLPILDAELLEKRIWCNAGIVDENVELAVPLQADKWNSRFFPELRI
jgi:hypothetical protein